jgi:anti-anti-sigma factor
MQPWSGASSDAPRRRRIRVPFRRARPVAARIGWPESEAEANRGFSADAGEREALDGEAQDELVVRHVERGGRQTLLLSGALSLDSVETLESAIRELDPQTTSAVTLDLRELVFIDSSGLWGVTTVRKWCTQAMIEFSIIPGPESVQNVFELTGLIDLLPFEPDRPADRGPTHWE